MKKFVLFLAIVLACSLLMVPMAFADTPSVVTMTQDEFGRLENASQVTPRYQVCCLNGPSLVWRVTSLVHIYPAGGGMCLGVNQMGDQYCQLCGHVWQSNVVYKYDPGCGRYHY